MSTDHNFRSERSAEADSNRGPSAYQPTALPQTALVFFVCLFLCFVAKTTMLPNTSVWAVYTETSLHHYNILLAAHSFTRGCTVNLFRMFILSLCRSDTCGFVCLSVCLLCCQNNNTAKHISVGRLFRNIHPSLQHASGSIIYASLNG